MARIYLSSIYRTPRKKASDEIDKQKREASPNMDGQRVTLNSEFRGKQ